MEEMFSSVVTTSFFPGVVLDGLVWWVLWHINLCRLFNAKSIFM